MTATLQESRTVDQRPSLAELRKAFPSGPSCDHADCWACGNRAIVALLDIAEAAQAMFETAGHDASPFDFEFEGDRIEAVENALAKVRA